MPSSMPHIQMILAKNYTAPKIILNSGDNFVHPQDLRAKEQRRPLRPLTVNKDAAKGEFSGIRSFTY